MKTVHALLAAATLATGCSNPVAVAQDAMLTLLVSQNESLIRWPRGDTTRIRLANGLENPKGFAGLEIVISGEGIPARTYTAPDFKAGELPAFRVPDTGYATVVARIVQDDRIVAEVSERWALEHEVQWFLELDRAPYPWLAPPDDLENPECRYWACHGMWRSPIVENMANYEHEALWVVLYRYNP